MDGKYFVAYHDENKIWNLRFKSAVRAAVTEYSNISRDITAKIRTGEIQTRTPICVRWDYSSGISPKLQSIILQARMNPVPIEFSYYIAYVFGTKLKLLEMQAFNEELNNVQIKRAYFMADEYEKSTQWLLDNSCLE